MNFTYCDGNLHALVITLLDQYPVAWAVSVYCPLDSCIPVQFEHFIDDG
jgi:hypothetical protein